jgi:hypothetical protein
MVCIPECLEELQVGDVRPFDSRIARGSFY